LKRFSFAVHLATLAVLATSLACAQRFAFERLDQSRGLRDLNVTALLQDRTGVLWVGTQSGVYRYDGYRLEMAPIAGTDNRVFITGLVEDGSGRIWFSTSDSLGYFEGSTGREISTPEQHLSFELSNRLSPDPDRPDRIYFVSGERLYAADAEAGYAARVSAEFSNSQISRRPELAKISGLRALEKDAFWLGCGDSICISRGQTLQVFDAKYGVPAEPWHEFFIDHRQALWARSEHHIVRWNRDANRFDNMGLNLPNPSLSVRQPLIREDAQGRVLINLTTGLARFENGSWRVFSEKTDLPPYQVNGFLRDRQGSIWLGLDGHGLARWLGYEQFENLTPANGLSGSSVVWNFQRDQHRDLWIATEGALLRKQWGTDRIEAQSDPHGTPLQRIQTLAITTDGHIWSGSDNGTVIDYDPVYHKARTVGQFGGVFQLLLGEHGTLWVCAMNGLFSIDTTGKTNSGPSQPLLRGHVFAGIHNTNGDDWFIAATGLYRRSGATWTHIHLPSDYRLAFSAQLAMAPDHTLWLSCAKPALGHLKIEGDTARELERFNSPRLISDSILTVAIDKRGWLWLGTDDGIDVYNGSRWRCLNTDDGLVWNDLDTGAFFEDYDGSIWVGTSGGASHILHPESLFNTQPPSLYLSDVRIGNVTWTPGNLLSVPWSKHPLTANLSTLDYNLANRVAFRYRIEGLNEEWQDSQKHDLRYPPFSPGHYQLAVMAVDSLDGLQSPVTYVEFEITPPWWRSDAIYAAEGLIGLLLLLGIWRWSVLRHVRNERRLKELVHLRTQELETEKAELLRARAALEEQATHDPLTGLLNHGAIVRSLQQAIERSTRERKALGVVLADLDHFKQVNDTYGHLVGDDVLHEFAKRIEAGVRTYDEVGRYGGEEILIILHDLDPDHARERLTRLHSAICDTPFAYHQERICVTASFGFTWLNPNCDTVATLIDRADQAMYMAKKNGRNRIEFSEDVSRPSGRESAFAELNS
jgi:diguanylate cyclase (GGDEF)-like protein